MNDNLRKAEKEYFISVYGEEAFKKLEEYMKSDLAKQRAKAVENMPYTQRPPSIRSEIDKENNLKQKEMEKFEDLFKDLEVQNDMTKKFSEIAEKLMNNFVIRANNKDFRLAEIEFYLYEQGKHEDDFIHSKILANGKQNESSSYQNKMANWYFHYSGIDLTFGDGNNRFGGVLIRSIVSKNDNLEIKGPLKLKNYLLNQYNNIFNNDNFLTLVHTSKDKKLNIKLDNNPRIGLGKTGNEDFKNRQYRFIVSKEKI